MDLKILSHSKGRLKFALIANDTELILRKKNVKAFALLISHYNFATLSFLLLIYSTNGKLLLKYSHT